jgi:hypothetical protein
MIWNTVATHSVPKLPDGHTVSVESFGDEFSWYVSLIEDDPSHDESLDDDQDMQSVHMSARGVADTIEQARVAAERAYRHLLAAYRAYHEATRPRSAVRHS